MSGIVGYGAYVPKYRVKTTDIADVWKKDASEISSALKITEKSVPSLDEDSVTLAIEASQGALQMAKIAAPKIQSVYFGSESHPYTVNPSSTITASYLGIGTNYFAADFEFACKAATAAMQATASLIDSKRIDYGLIIGSDTAQGKPHDILEYTAASAAAAYVLGNKPSEIIAEIIDTSSTTSDTPDFWRREGAKYPSHFGRFTGEPAYFSHVVGEGKKLLELSTLKPQDFAYCVFHMPNGKFPRIAAKTLGFTDKQLMPSLIVDKIGNPYSASALLGLCAVLDIAQPKDKIFFVSYGSGAGSDGFIFEVKSPILKKRNTNLISKMLDKKEYVSYAQYLKQKHII